MTYDGKEVSTWLAASYEMASIFTCRMPMSSPHSGLALPTPGPSTVRMAIIRSGIELYGAAFVKETLFDVIVSAPILIQPPRKIAISSHITHAYKSEPLGLLSKTVAYRGFAHAEGPMTIYMNVPKKLEEAFTKIFLGIGYWGKSNSITSCVETKCASPKPGYIAMPLSETTSGQNLRDHFTSLVTEFGNNKVGWFDVVPNAYQVRRSPIKLELYIWPLVYTDRRTSGSLLSFQALDQRMVDWPFL